MSKFLAPISPPLPVASGGTGLSSATAAGGIVYASSTSALATTAAGVSGQVLTSAGAGAPTWTTPLQAAVTASLTAPVANITTTAVVWATAPNIVGNGVKKFKITASFWEMTSTVSGDVYDITINDSTLSTVLKNLRVSIFTVTALIISNGVTIVAIDTPAVGNHVYTATAKRVAGTGTGIVQANATGAPIDIIVEQIA